MSSIAGLAQADDQAPSIPTEAVAVELPATPSTAPVGFQVRLANFTGPFDLLLQLIGKQKLEITELSISSVTDEFISYIRSMGDRWSLDEASDFLVVAATLLDLKAARLLPKAEVEDEEDLALLEARDLLFARLLQYKAFKEAASIIAAREAEFSRGYPRSVKLEPRFADALPDLVLGVGAQRLAELAGRALRPRIPPTVATDHVHMVRVNVREHALILRDKLVRSRAATFRVLCADCATTLEVVARFLALLELYREGLIAFDQSAALGELTITWTGDESADVVVVDEYDGLIDPGPATHGVGDAGPTEADLTEGDPTEADLTGSTPTEGDPIGVDPVSPRAGTDGEETQ